MPKIKGKAEELPVEEEEQQLNPQEEIQVENLELDDATSPELDELRVIVEGLQTMNAHFEVRKHGQPGAIEELSEEPADSKESGGGAVGLNENLEGVELEENSVEKFQGDEKDLGDKNPKEKPPKAGRFKKWLRAFGAAVVAGAAMGSLEAKAQFPGGRYEMGKNVETPKTLEARVELFKLIHKNFISEFDTYKEGFEKMWSDARDNHEKKLSDSRITKVLENPLNPKSSLLIDKLPSALTHDIEKDPKTGKITKITLNAGKLANQMEKFDQRAKRVKDAFGAEYDVAVAEVNIIVAQVEDAEDARMVRLFTAQIQARVNYLQRLNNSSPYLRYSKQYYPKN